MKRRLLYTTILCSAALMVPLVVPAFANPVGGTVVGGSATISQNGSTVTINQSSNKSIIQWSGFDIAPGETTQFIQPSSGAIALNRIQDSKPSQIEGSLLANGNIILINPYGVVFGKTASVNVNSLVVSTSDIDNNSFMNSQSFVFNKPGMSNGSIVNNGQITVQQAGLVGFVAPHVQNNGTINARLGQVTLASGDTFTLDLAGDGLTNIAVTGPMQSQLVQNLGIITADGGRVVLTAADARTLVDSLVMNSGTIRADSFVNENGTIVLYNAAANGVVSNSGVIQSKGVDTGVSGGTVSLNAATVQQNGTIDVDGQGNGGAVDIAFSTQYTDTASSIISAHAGDGNGGFINLHGDASAASTLDAYGDYDVASDNGIGGAINLYAGSYIATWGAHFTASGSAGGGSIQVGVNPTGAGANTKDVLIDSVSVLSADATDTGNGGHIKIWADDYTGFYGTIFARGGANGGNGGFVETSAHFLDADGVVNASAAKGSAGLWLLDPSDLTVVASGNSGTLASSGTNPITWATTNSSNQDTIGADTIVNSLNAGTSVVLQTSVNGTGGNGDIIVNAPITSTGNGDLTLSAYRNINVNTSISLADGNLTMDARNANGSTGYIYVSGSLLTHGGNITLGGGSAPITAGSGYAIGDGNNGTSYGIHLGADVEAGGGNIIMNGMGGTYSNSDIGIFGNNNYNLAGTSGTGTITLNGIGTNSAGGSNIGVYAPYGGIVSSGSGAITINGTAGTGGGSDYGIYVYVDYGNVGGSSFSGPLVLSASGLGMYVGGGTVGTTSTSGIDFTNVTDLYNNGGMVIYSPNHSVTINGTVGDVYVSTVTSGGPVTITSSSGNVSTGDIIASTTSGNAITLSAAGNISTGNVTGSNIFMDSNTANAASGYIYISGGLNAGSGNITLGGGSGTITAGNGYAIGGSGNGANNGIRIFGNVSTNGGNIIMNGQGGTYAGGSNIGIFGTSNYDLASTSGTGTITLNGIGGTGTGGSNIGIYAPVGGIVSTGSGAMTITGIAGTGGGSDYGFYIGVDYNNVGGSSFSGPMSITATGLGLYGGGGTISTTDSNSIDFSNVTDIAGGISINTPNHDIILNGTAGDMNVGNLTGIGTITVTSTTGNVTTGSIATTGGAVTITSNLGYVSTGNIVTSTSSSNPVQIEAATNISTGGITGSSVYVDSNTANGASGYIYINGGITTNGGNITLGGGSAPITAGNGYAIGDGNNGTSYGIRIFGDVEAHGGNIIMNGMGGTYSNSDIGIFGSSNYNLASTSGAGTITLNGIGTNSSGGSNLGIYAPAGGIVSTGNGAIIINGTAGTGGGSDYGVYVYVDYNNIGGASYSGPLTIKATGLGLYVGGGTIGTTSASGIDFTNVTDVYNNGGMDIYSPNHSVTINGTVGDVYVANVTSGGPVTITSSSGNVTTGNITAPTTSGNDVIVEAANNISTYAITGSSIYIDSNTVNGATGYVIINGGLTAGAGNITLGGGSGTITAGNGYAIGNSTNGTNYGIRFYGNASSSGGTIIMNGEGGTYTGGSNFGIFGPNNSFASTSGTGTITLNGIGGTGAGGSNDGIYAPTGGILSSGTGAITMTGVAGTGGGSNYGIYIGVDYNNVGGGSFSGPITISANGLGMYVTQGTISTTGNSVNLSNVTDIDGSPSIYAPNAAIAINGTVGNLNLGNVTAGGAVTLTSSTGYITTGNIVTNTTGASAVNVSAAGNITTYAITGQSVLIDANTNDAATGYIIVNGAINAAGNITLGGGSSAITAGHGFAIGDASSGWGVEVLGGVNANGGNIIINGKGGSTGSYNYGVRIYTNASAATTTGTGTISITGIGGTGSGYNYGISIDNGGITSTGNGAITLTGVMGSGSNYGIAIGGSGVGSGSYSGAITLIADSMINVTGQTTGNITLKPYTVGASIGVGNGATGTLSLSDSFLGGFNSGAGKYLTIGDSTNTGTVTINTGYTFTKPVQFVSGAGYDIVTAGQINSSSTEGAANAVVVLDSGRNYVNTYGSNVFNLTGTNTPRWLIYSVAPNQNTVDGLALPTEYYNTVYANYQPTAVTLTGNVMFYSTSLGTIYLTANNATSAYGATPSLNGYTFSCSTGCSSSLITGTPVLSTNVTQTSNVGSYTITTAVGTVTAQSSNNGYVIDFVNGTYTVTPAPLTITASNESKTYGTTLTFNGSEYTSTALQNGETIGAVNLTSTGAAANAAGGTSYMIVASNASGGTFTSSNYNITYAPGTLTVSAGPVTTSAPLPPTVIKTPVIATPIITPVTTAPVVVSTPVTSTPVTTSLSGSSSSSGTGSSSSSSSSAGSNSNSGSSSTGTTSSNSGASSSTNAGSSNAGDNSGSSTGTSSSTTTNSSSGESNTTNGQTQNGNGSGNNSSGNGSSTSSSDGKSSGSAPNVQNCATRNQTDASGNAIACIQGDGR